VDVATSSLRSKCEALARLQLMDPDAHPAGPEAHAIAVSRLEQDVATIDAALRDAAEARARRDPWLVWDRYLAKPREHAALALCVHDLALLAGPSPAHRRTGRGARAATRARVRAIRELVGHLRAVARGESPAARAAAAELAVLDPDTYLASIAPPDVDLGLTSPGRSRRLDLDVRRAVDRARWEIAKAGLRLAVGVAAAGDLLGIRADEIKRLTRR
jgi:hypothetical protein